MCVIAVFILRRAIDTIVVNLFGAPGSGKSTGAAYIFSKLKMLGVDAELVTEYAKDKVWENNTTALSNQTYVFGKQHFRISRCEDKVDVIITDSPLLLSAIYNKSELLGEDFNNLVAKIFKSYTSVNYFITRTKPYNANGRLQTEDESNKISDEIKEMLSMYDVIYTEIKGDTSGYDKVVFDICRNLPKWFEYEKMLKK